MVRRRRLSRQQTQELWDRWSGLKSLETSAATLSLSPIAAFGEIRGAGGIPPPPRDPPVDGADAQRTHRH